METIYDHNPTMEEANYISEMSKDEYLKFIDGCDFSAKYDLALLFWYRNNKEKVEYYINDFDYLDKLDFYRTVTHP